jgi:ElaB/YqjD/DUF883 family membrane-anchored ribosome-binding protein
MLIWVIFSSFYFLRAWSYQKILDICHTNAQALHLVPIILWNLTCRHKVGPVFNNKKGDEHMAIQQNYTPDRNADTKRTPGNTGYGADGVAHDQTKGIVASGAAMMEQMQEDTSDMAKSVVADVKSFASGYIDSIEKEVKTNPVQSVAIAFGAGILLSFLFGRV